MKQAQSKQKIIDKMVEAGLTKKVVPDPVFRFTFPNSEKIPPPVMAFQDVSFAYSGKKEDYLYTNLEFGIDCDSRIALVGPNGAGKSTLLKLMTQDIKPTEGDIRRNPHLRIGRYNQHSEDVLDLDKCPLDFMRDMFPEGIVTAEGHKKMDVTDWRGKLGIFGVTGEKQTLPMKTMSPGFRARVVFCLMSLRNPHLLLLDEPTNPLDMDMIDSLANAIKKFTGGIVLVSHDFRLLEQEAPSQADGGAERQDVLGRWRPGESIPQAPPAHADGHGEGGKMRPRSRRRLRRRDGARGGPDHRWTDAEEDLRGGVAERDEAGPREGGGDTDSGHRAAAAARARVGSVVEWRPTLYSRVVSLQVQSASSGRDGTRMTGRRARPPPTRGSPLSSAVRACLS